MKQVLAYRDSCCPVLSCIIPDHQRKFKVVINLTLARARPSLLAMLAMARAVVVRPSLVAVVAMARAVVVRPSLVAVVVGLGQWLLGHPCWQCLLWLGQWLLGHPWWQWLLGQRLLGFFLLVVVARGRTAVARTFLVAVVVGLGQWLLEHSWWQWL